MHINIYIYNYIYTVYVNKRFFLSKGLHQVPIFPAPHLQPMSQSWQDVDSFRMSHPGVLGIPHSIYFRMIICMHTYNQLIVKLWICIYIYTELVD